MISVIIGGGREEKIVLRHLSAELGKPPVISTDDPKAFLTFCKNAIRSTEVLKIRKGTSDYFTEKIANDNMIVFFPETYFKGLAIPFIYKLATVIETAIDMGLNVQVFSFGEEKSWNAHKLTWPSHWPPVTYFTTETQER